MPVVYLFSELLRCSFWGWDTLKCCLLVQWVVEGFILGVRHTVNVVYLFSELLRWCVDTTLFRTVKEPKIQINPVIVNQHRLAHFVHSGTFEKKIKFFKKHFHLFFWNKSQKGEHFFFQIFFRNVFWKIEKKNSQCCNATFSSAMRECKSVVHLLNSKVLETPVTWTTWGNHSASRPYLRSAWTVRCLHREHIFSEL